MSADLPPDLPPSLLRRAGEAVGVVVVCLAASVGLSWPLARDASTHWPSNPDMPDLQVGLWLPGQLLDAISHGSSPWHARGLLFPHGQDISQHVWNLALPGMLAPLYVVLEPLTAYNLALIGLCALNGAAGWVLGRRLGGVAGGLGAAGLLLSSPFAWNELMQGRLEQGFLAGLCLTLSGLLALRHKPDLRDAVVVGLVWALTGLAYWFYGYWLLLVVAGLGLEAVLRRRWDQLRALATAGVVSALTVAPMAGMLVWGAAASGSIYRRGSEGMNQTGLEMLTGVASLGVRHLVWPLHPPELLRDVLPVTALVVFGALVSRKVRRTAGVLGWVALVGLVLALGRQLQWAPGELVMVGDSALSLPFAWSQALLPGFSRLWWPYRFLALFTVAGAGVAAAGVGVLGSRWRSLGLAGLLVTFSAVELRAATTRTQGGLLWDAPLEASTSTFFEDLAKHPDTHPLFVMPYRGMSSSRPHWLAVHRQPVSQGINEAEDFLLPESANTRDADHPTLAYLKQAGRSIDARVVGAPPADMAADLQALGFHYAVLWRMDRPREQVYVRWFGPPDHEGPLVLAWDLRASR